MAARKFKLPRGWCSCVRECCSEPRGPIPDREWGAVTARGSASGKTSPTSQAPWRRPTNASSLQCEAVPQAFVWISHTPENSFLSVSPKAKHYLSSFSSMDCDSRPCSTATDGHTNKVPHVDTLIKGRRAHHTATLCQDSRLPSPNPSASGPPLHNPGGGWGSFDRSGPIYVHFSQAWTACHYFLWPRQTGWPEVGRVVPAENYPQEGRHRHRPAGVPSDPKPQSSHLYDFPIFIKELDLRYRRNAFPNSAFSIPLKRHGCFLENSKFKFKNTTITTSHTKTLHWPRPASASTAQKDHTVCYIVSEDVYLWGTFIPWHWRLFH